MSLKPGDWVLLGRGRPGQVQEIVDGPNGPVALALDVRGEIAERPLANAEVRWRPIPVDGVTVLLATDPAGAESMATGKPVDVIVAALTELGGAGTVKQIKSLLVPAVVSTDTWAVWWRRTQGLVMKDERIDPSHARERRYRLLRQGEARLEPTLGGVTASRTAGGSSLDLRTLRSLAAKVRAGRPLSAADGKKLEVAASMARAGSGLDATERFFALDAAVQAGIVAGDEARSALGPRILDADLMRLTSPDDRGRALAWAAALDDSALLSWSPEPSDPDDTGVGTVSVPPIVLSGAALGGEVARSAADLARRVGSWQIAFPWAILGWSPPGSREARREAGAADLRSFERRVEKARRLIPTLDASDRSLFVAGAARAVHSLLDTKEPSKARHDIARAVAETAWAPVGDAGLVAITATFAAIGPDAVVTLIETAPADQRLLLQDAVVARYVADRATGLTPLVAWCTTTDRDPGAFLLSIALEAARADGIAETSVHAVGNATSASSRAASVSLAVTLGLDGEPAVDAAASQQVSQLMAALDDALAEPAAPVVLRSRAVEHVTREVRRRGEEAAAAINDLTAERDHARATVRLLETEVERIRSELRSTKGTRADLDRTAVNRLAGRILRPFAMALADSYESKDLEALQDALIGLFERGGVRLTVDVGERQEFDPRRHRWVGEGPPTRMIRALSPGFEIVADGGEGADEIVVVPARVVAANTAD